MAGRRLEVAADVAARAARKARSLLSADPSIGRAARYALYAATQGELPTDALAAFLETFTAGMELPAIARVVMPERASNPCRDADFEKNPACCAHDLHAHAGFVWR